jgi:hypothetical protein
VKSVAILILTVVTFLTLEMQAFKQYLGGGINYESLRKDLDNPTRASVDAEDSEDKAVSSPTVFIDGATTPVPIKSNEQRAEYGSLLSPLDQRYTVGNRIISRTADSVSESQHASDEELLLLDQNRDETFKIPDVSSTARWQKSLMKKQPARGFDGPTRAVPLRSALTRRTTLKSRTPSEVNQSSLILDSSLIKEQRQRAKLKRKLMEEKMWLVFFVAD